MKPNILYGTKIIYEIRDLLELPIDHNQDCKARKIYRTIINTIVQALRRGESVEIPRFGIFRLRTRPPTFKTLRYWHGGITEAGKAYEKDVTLPAKTYVYFTPSRGILKNLNEGTTHNAEVIK